jgi:hypothetical protein
VVVYLLRLPQKHTEPLFVGGLVPQKHPFGGILERQQTAKCLFLNMRGTSSPMYNPPLDLSSIDSTMAEGSKGGVYRLRNPFFSSDF